MYKISLTEKEMGLVIDCLSHVKNQAWTNKRDFEISPVHEAHDELMDSCVELIHRLMGEVRGFDQ